jgi:hypothetical protein
VAVVHPDLDPVIGRGQDIQVAVAIDVRRDDAMRVDVIAPGDLLREAVRVTGVRRNRGRQSAGERQAEGANEDAARKHPIGIIPSDPKEAVSA